MTPTAATSAGRAKKPPARSAGHKRSARPASPPRRVSGPVSTAKTTRRAPAPAARPRRVSGPARSRRPAPSLRPSALPARLGQFVRRLPDHSLLDQVVRGRAWIPLLGVLLAGIVAMQVEVLKLSASMGRSLQQGTAQQSRNEQLRASVAQLSDDQRIERIAAGMGMVMPAPTEVKFLPRSPAGQLRRAVGGIQAPNPSAFAATLAADQAALSVGTTAATTSSTASTGATAATAPTIAQAAPAPVTSATTSPGVPSSTPSATTTPAPATSTAPVTPAPATSTPTYSPTPSAGGAAAAGAVATGSGG